MYVRPAFRRQGIGGKLVELLIAEARQMGYRTMYLDTHIDQQAAHRLYSSFGFKVTEAYFPVPEEFRAVSIFMKLDLM
jgi:ribosomal protein S18 acetylase RimI-like enzyme